jgi:hypothetical protein
MRNTLPKSGTFLLGHPVYRVMQEERSILWEVTVSVIVSKNVHMNMLLILNGYRDTAA